MTITKDMKNTFLLTKAYWTKTIKGYAPLKTKSIGGRAL